MIKAKEIKKDSSGKVVEIICEYSAEVKKLKGRVHWISDKDATRVEVRLYDYLFNSENPMELVEPLEDMNPNSLIIKHNSLVNKNILNDIKPLDHFQFERLGYFVADYDTNASSGRYVFNLTVDLGDEKIKKSEEVKKPVEDAKKPEKKVKKAEKKKEESKTTPKVEKLDEKVVETIK